MNPKDQIHYDIAELLEKIAHLNIKLAGTAKIHPVELDLLRSYLTELDKLADAMPVMPMAKPSFVIPTSPQEEPTTLPSFNTPMETVPDEAPAADEPIAEQPTIEEAPVQVDEPTLPEAAVEETPRTEAPADAFVNAEPETTEEAAIDVDAANDDHAATAAATTESEDGAIDEPFAFDDLAAPITETTENQETEQEEPVAENSPVQNETPDDVEPASEITEPTANDLSTSFVDTPTANDEPEAAPTPEPLPQQPEEEPQANTGPELPIVETPLSYKPPVKEPEPKRSINDMFSREGKEDLGSRFQFQNRKNLREMIDLSERYVFTKELFGGDTDYYDRAIRQLNQFESFADAQAYMDNDLHHKYNWANKEQVKKQFVRIVERRFA